MLSHSEEIEGRKCPRVGLETPVSISQRGWNGRETALDSIFITGVRTIVWNRQILETRGNGIRSCCLVGHSEVEVIYFLRA